MIKSKEKNKDYGLIVEGLVVVLAFFFVTITVIFFLNKQVDFSLKNRQISMDYDRAGLYSELPVMVLTADGNPILKSQARINDIFRTYSEIASRNSIVGFPLCMFLVESELVSGSVQLTRLTDYEYECNTYGLGIPTCGVDGIADLYNVNGENKQYFIVSFYLKDGDLINEKCAIARGTYKEILEPPFVFPTNIPPSPSPSPTTSPTVSPSESPVISPTVEPTTSPTVIPTETPTIIPTLEPTTSPSVLPTESPTITPAFSPTISPTVVPTETPVISPTAKPTITATEIPTLEASEIPKDTVSIAPTIVPSVEPSRPIAPEPSLEDSELPFTSASESLAFSFTGTLDLNKRVS